MKLKNLLGTLDYEVLEGSLEDEIKDICINSKQAAKDSLFIAIEGFKVDGHEFIGEAARRGAKAAVIQKDINLNFPMIKIKVPDTRAALAGISSNFYQGPTTRLKLIGVTGTNGKTTTSFLLDSIFRKAGLKCSMITTVQSFLDQTGVEFDRTTPGALELNRFFAESWSQGVEAAVMEVSSHSVDLHRVDHIQFEGFIFTNLSQDHLDYHQNMENYFQAKLKLFSPDRRPLYGGRFAVINKDDPYGQKIIAATDLPSLTYSAKNPADLKAENIINSIEGLSFNLWLKGEKWAGIRSGLSGMFNVYNIMAAAGAAHLLGISPADISSGIRELPGVPGRFEKIDTGQQFSVIVDYAHTPDGLENVLSTIKQLNQEKGRIITIFGCGGDRDKQKRKLMGQVSSKYSDISIITSDNPRTENPSAIIGMIEQGFGAQDSYLVIEDRRKAIEEGLSIARPKDIILIAGKGHEDYQEFADYRIHFSDQETVKDILKG